MEDRRTALALILCVLFVVTYTQWVMAPTKTVVPVVSTDAALAGTTATGVAIPGSQKVVAATTLKATDYAASESIRFETDVVEGKLSLLGGRLQQYRLLRYKKTLNEKDPLDLVVVSDSGDLPLGVRGEGFDDSAVAYTVASVTGATIVDGAWQAEGSVPLVVTLQGKLGNGDDIQKIVSMTPGSYIFSVRVIAGATPRLVQLSWNRSVPKDDPEARINPKQFTLVNPEDALKNIALTELEATPVLDKGKNRWVGFTDKYFIEALVSKDMQDAYRLRRVGDEYIVDQTGQEFLIYAGPIDVDTLRVAGFSLDKSIDLGFFSFVSHPLLGLLRFFFSLTNNYGLAIILLTLLIKNVFLPLNNASFKSMQQMQEIQPEVQALRERIKDATQLNVEMMALYKRKGVNPIGGCLPVLVQIPVFFGLYSALYSSIELLHAPFALWIQDLTSPEKLAFGPINLPIMILLMGASMFYQQYTQPSAMDPQQRKMMLFMPLVFTGMFIMFPMPSGLVLYWLVNNIVSIVQQVSLRNGKNPFVVTVATSLAIVVVAYTLTLV